MFFELVSLSKEERYFLKREQIQFSRCIITGSIFYLKENGAVRRFSCGVFFVDLNQVIFALIQYKCKM